MSKLCVCVRVLGGGRGGGLNINTALYVPYCRILERKLLFFILRRFLCHFAIRIGG